MNDVTRQRIVVVGGSSGVGRAVARLFAARGAHVVIGGRDAGKLAATAEALAHEAAAHDGAIDTHVVDATDRAALAAFFTEVGSCDHLVLTLSGAAGAGSFRTLDLAQLRRGFEAKLWAQLEAAQAALGALRPDGSITFVTAISARMANPGTAGLAAINGALEAMIRPLAVELRPMRVNAVSPGVIDTPWWDMLPAGDKAAAFARYAAVTPLGRIGRADEVADAIALLVDNAFITGTVLEVDGGLRLG